MFDCDTKHTGCKIGCFNRHSPMSSTRFFQMMILIISIPKLMFYLFVSHENAEYELEKQKFNKIKAKKQEEFRKKIEEWQKKLQAGMKDMPKPEAEVIPEPASLTEARLSIRKNYYMGNAAEVLWTRPIVIAQMVHFVAILFIEFTGLIVLNWLTQAAMGVVNSEWKFFNISAYNYPEHYVCQQDSVNLLSQEPLYNCGNGDKEECYVSRPAEKKLFLWYMIAVSIMSIILVLMDIILLTKNHLTKHRARQQVAKQTRASQPSLNGTMTKPLLPQ